MNFISPFTSNGCSLFTQRFSPRILVTGTGRLHTNLVHQAMERGIDLISSTRSSKLGDKQIQINFNEDETTLKKIIEKHNIKVVVNSAAQSNGSYADIKHANTIFPERFAKVCKEEGVTFMQMSSTAALYPVSLDCPYALTKKEAEAILKDHENTKIFRLDALIGCDSKPDVSFLTSFGKKFGVSLHFEDIAGCTIQPTTYEAASKAMLNYIAHIIDGKDVSIFGKEINIAGYPVEINEFIRSANTTGLRFNTNLEAFSVLASQVNVGALSPEFIALAKIAKENPVTLCSKAFEQLHGSRIPQLGCMMNKIDSTVGLRSYIAQFDKLILSNPKPLELIRSALPIYARGSFEFTKKP